MLLIPIGHQQASVRRLPWVTIGIAAVCLVVRLWSSTVEPDILREGEAIVAEMEQVEAQLHGRTRVRSGQGELFEGLGDGLPGVVGQQKDDASAREMRETLTRRLAELEAQRDRLIERLPSSRLGYRPGRDGLWRMLTSAFAHGGWMHLLGNMLFLYLVGCNMEDRWGRGRFLGFYLIGALLSALAYRIWHPGGTQALVGASGAIAGAMGAFTVCYARTSIQFFYFYWLMFRPRWGTFMAPAWLALPLWFAEQALFSLFEGRGTHVAYSAHVGGFLYGLAVAGVLYATGVDGKLLEERDRPERPEDEWSVDPALADASDLAARGQTLAALQKLEALLERAPDHAAARELAWQQAVILREPERVRIHLGAAFTHWLRHGEPERVASTYRSVRERDAQLELGEAALKAVISTSGRPNVDPVVIIDAASQLIRQHPESVLLPRAMWAASEAQTRVGRGDLAQKTLQNILVAFPMDPFAEQARRKLGHSLRPASASAG